MEKENKETANPAAIDGNTTANIEDLPETSAAASPHKTAQKEDLAETAEQASAEPAAEVAAADWAQEKEELIGLVQRKQADLDNFRRISRMKEEEIREYSLFEFLEKLLPVLDNLERALVMAREDEGVPESYLKGLSMIQKQLQQLLEQEGVVEIEALGKQFDPRHHEAVIQITEGEGEPGSVVEELQKGYLYKDRVLRHAKVKVMQH